MKHTDKNNQNEKIVDLKLPTDVISLEIIRPEEEINLL